MIQTAANISLPAKVFSFPSDCLLIGSELHLLPPEFTGMDPASAICNHCAECCMEHFMVDDEEGRVYLQEEVENMMSKQISK